ncbi:hypothetical protein DML75_23840 [Salmonella enterica subsp. enterica serovar Typhimurium]|uniref:Uncharacterized protein n=1 Tax=Salmonella enterica TaxID=28901 RepID=A0A5T8GUU9_SALER|nr:hypothetical protein [Salmonella enterica]ECB5119169.1 hypothetical protein [Salmonella enterica subsp. enterica serovar Typhimurium]ECG9979303.1 hypothetical protein [Salmonella enterica subsp. enterica serovar Typhimurium]ECS9432386.1 hypothetical protein [Salmonella enterica subsp. enterica serovar Typhimurium]ECU2627641.1 hypothetical protein [Salmonella enterica subsp. enterica serovar Typhimurium]
MKYTNVQSENEEKIKDIWSKMDFSTLTKADDVDLKKIEGMLSLRYNVLAGSELYLEKYTCICGKLLQSSDLIETALNNGHDPSFVLHTLLGNKYILNKPRTVRCSDCGTDSSKPLMYGQNGCYLCPKL